MTQNEKKKSIQLINNFSFQILFIKKLLQAKLAKLRPWQNQL
jgi:hypothetical protein